MVEVSRPTGDLVVCSLEAWDTTWRRNQFLVRELLGLDPNRRVLFVEPPLDLIHEARGEGRLRRPAGLRPLPQDPRVSLFQPVKALPRVLGPTADAHLRQQIRAAARRVGLDDPVLWVNDHNYAGLASATGWPAVYDITDDWTQAAGPARIKQRIRDDEEVLYGECASVVVCSQDLCRTRPPSAGSRVLIPNAVDAAHFTRPTDRPDDLPPSPVAVYVGTVHPDRVDLDLVEATATELADLQLTLVGPLALTADERHRLDRHPNIHLLGPRPYDQVPGYLQHADVVIVPHVISPFTESLDPIKAYECLAVGTPTIATPVAGFRDLGDPILTATPQDFVDALRAELAAPSPRQPRPVPSWHDRALAFDDELRHARQVAAERGADAAKAGLRTVIVCRDHPEQLERAAELAAMCADPSLVVVGAAATPSPQGVGASFAVEGPGWPVHALQLAGRTGKQAPSRPVVHLVDPSLLAGALVLARGLGAALVCDSQPGRAELGFTANQERLLRWFKPVVAIGDRADRGALARSVPTAVVGSTAEDRCDAIERLMRLHRLTAQGPRFLAVNARYAGRPVTGVERFATNAERVFDDPMAGFGPSPRFASGPLGHLWEQVVLPLRCLAYDTALWSPCNFGPLVLRKQLITVHDISPIDHPEWFSVGYRTWSRLATQILWRRARWTSTVSAFSRDRLQAQFGRGAVVIPEAVDPPILSTAAETPPTPADLPAGPFVCALGSVEPRKNLRTLIEAVADVRATHPCELVLIGDRPNGVFAAAEFDPRPWIHWMGRLDDATTAAVVRRSVCLAAVSLYEGFGLPALEALAIGTLVVASDIPSIREACGDHPRYANPRDPAGIARQIEACLETSADERQVGIARGRAWAAERSWADAAATVAATIWGPDTELA